MSKIADIMALAALERDARQAELSQLVEPELAAAITPVLDLPATEAQPVIRRLVATARDPVIRVEDASYDIKPDQWFPRPLLAELKNACETDQEYALIALGYWCALRACEYTILQWQDMGWDPQSIRHGRTDVLRVTRIKKRRRVGNRLLARMAHDVILNKGTVGALRRWWSNRDGVDAGSPWIFPGQDGQQSCPKTIVRRFQRIAARCRSYDPREYRWCRIHSLRHTMAVHMVEGGFEMVDIQTRLGHSSIETTQIYAQMTTPRKRDVSRAMSLSEAVAIF